MKTIQSMMVPVNSAIVKSKACIMEDADNAARWLNNIICQTEKEALIKKDRCEMCNSKEDSQDLELHHIAGRKHDYRCITVCQTCHRWLSITQKIRDGRWWKEDQPSHLKEAFFLLGLHDILLLMYEKTGNYHYKRIVIGLVEEISKRLKE